jgi:hypothetical protein
MRIKNIILVLTFGIASLLLSPVYAGDINPPNGPDANAMFNLENVYQRLIDGTPGNMHTGFANPTAGPGSTMHSINQIMEKLPAKDDANGANPEHVMAGKTYWGLTTGKWGKQTGTMVIQSLNAASANVPAGYYAATTLDAVDEDLISANIKAGVTIFGVEGKTEVVDTSSGDAVAANVSMGKKAWVDGVEVTGRLAGGRYCDPAKTYSPLGRWCDNGDGTVTDTTTGLIWLKDWSKNFGSYDPRTPLGRRTYYRSTIAVSNYTIAVEAPGTWRLPTRQEFKDICLKGVERVGIGTTGHLFINIPSSNTEANVPYEYTYVYYWCCGPVDKVSGYDPDCNVWDLTHQKSCYQACASQCFAVPVMGPLHPDPNP